jgi:hypothetical protein
VFAELTWNTFRNHLIAEYEIPTYEGDLDRPNTYVALTRAHADRKVDLLMRHYPSQASRQWFKTETFHSLMIVRGNEAVLKGEPKHSTFGSLSLEQRSRPTEAHHQTCTDDPIVGTLRHRTGIFAYAGSSADGGRGCRDGLRSIPKRFTKSKCADAWGELVRSILRPTLESS